MSDIQSENKKEEEPKAFELAVWKKMFKFLDPYKKPLIFIIIFSVLCALVDTILPLLQEYAIITFILPKTTIGIMGYVGMYMLILIFQCIFTFIFIRKSTFVENDLSKTLRSKSFTHLQKLSVSYYNTNSVGYMMSRITSDTSKISGMISWGIMDTMWCIFFLGGAFIVMFIKNYELALLVLIIVPGIVLTTMFFQKKILQSNRKVRHINSKITGEFNEGIGGAKTSKTLSIQDLTDKEFFATTSEMKKHSIRAHMLNAVYLPFINFFSAIGISLVIVSGGGNVLENAYLIAEFSVFITYAVSIVNPISRVAELLAETIATQVNIERLSNLLAEKPLIEESEKVLEKYGDSFTPKFENFEPIRGDIEFKDVSFKYPDGSEYILENFNLKISAGTNVAIVGETGAGKSTLVNLVCRFFEPTSGQILVDGVDYRERSQLWLHQSMGYVLQNPHLFSGSVMENIRYGNLTATDEDIIQSAKYVSADIVIGKLEDGYNTDVGEGGDRLSSGEKQLVSFARAIIADPRIFILDEATSSIDTLTEQLIQGAIAHLLKGRTSFLIAHRLSTIRHADVILVVKDGKIIERGSHSEMMKAKSYYHELYTRQYRQEEEEHILA